MNIGESDLIAIKTDIGVKQLFTETKMYLTKFNFTGKNKMLSIPYEVHRTLYNIYHPDQRILFRIDGKSLYMTTPDKPHGDMPYNCECEFIEQYDKLIDENKPLEFRLLLNPTFKNAASRKILPIYDRSKQLQWIARKFERSGATVMDIIIKKIEHNKDRKPDKWALPLYKIDTIILLRINDKQKFTSFAQHGIGRSKAFGCGLLVPHTI